MKTNGFLLAVVVILLVALAVPELAHACPNCKEAYASDNGASLSGGFSASILFMMGMPFLVVGGFVLRLWTAQKKLRRQAARP